MAFVQEFFTSRGNYDDGDVRIGQIDRLWYDSNTQTIRVGDGETPGGIVIGSGDGGTYVLPTASTTVKGGVKIDGATLSVVNAVLSVVNGVYTTGSYDNPTWIASLAYSKLSGAPTSLNAFTNDPGYLTSFTETDPTVPSHVKGISVTSIANWNTAYSWGDHASAGYASIANINLEGGTVNQVLVKKSETDYDYQWEELIVNPTYTKLLDDTISGTIYVGEAIPNSTESNAVWRIQKIVLDSSGNVDSVRFASGGTFNQIWNDRTTLSYI